MTDARRYDAWHGDLEADRGDAPWHELVKRRLDWSRDVSGRRLLEIGCGRGGFAVWLATRSNPPSAFHAADYSPVAVRKAAELARQANVTGIQWEVADIEALSHRDKAFDTVVSCETVEHVPDPRRAMRELARVLRPGGRLLLTTPNYLGSYGLYRAYLRATGRRYTEGGQPINHFTMLPRTIAWIRSAGLRVVAVDGVGHYLHVPRRQPVRLHFLDRVRGLTRWTALHSLVIAEKPAG